MDLEYRLDNNVTDISLASLLTNHLEALHSIYKTLNDTYSSRTGEIEIHIIITIITPIITAQIDNYQLKAAEYYKESPSRTTSHRLFVKLTSLCRWQ